MMRSLSRITLPALLGLALASLLPATAGCGVPRSSSRLVVGYSTGAVLHAQIGTIWAHTDILRRHGFAAEVFPVRLGSQQARLFKSGAMDIGFGREVSTVQALLTDPGLRIIAGPGELGRVGLIVPGLSGITSPAALKGATIGLALRSNAHKALRLWVTGPVRLQSLKPDRASVSAALASGAITAAVVWDPLLEELLQAKTFRLLAWRTFNSHLLARAAYVGADARKLKELRAALADALAYLQAHPEQVNLWAAHAMQLEPAVVAAVANYNGYYAGKRKPTIENMRLTPGDRQALREDWQFLHTFDDRLPDIEVTDFIAP
jgi:ABC-type nitrate/sulfonate/bicarbonate transport system substrate-binding protein